MSADQELAIKRVTGNTLFKWRVYEVIHSNLGPYTHVLRDDEGEIRNFDSEDSARAFIESMPDATEVDYPSA
jgi:hypothetical protein